MEKVYFDAETNKWVVKDLSDFYSFKCNNLQTSEEKSLILTWTKVAEDSLKSDYGVTDTDVRLYVVEIGDIKIRFLLRYDDGVSKVGKFILTPLDVYEMELIGTVFIGETEIKDGESE